MREGLLQADQREGRYMLQEDLDDRPKKAGEGKQPGIGRGSFKDVAQPSSSTGVHPDLIDFHAEPTTSPQDAEIRSVIFNYPSPPLTRSSTPSIRLAAEPYPSIYTVAAPPAPPLSPHVRHSGLAVDSLGVTETGNEVGAASTTFSFLSLSQASSPEVPTRMLDSWACADAEGSTVRTQEERGGEHQHVMDVEDDLISHPGTAISDYIDAETYTPFGERSISPSYPAFPDIPFRDLSPASAGHSESFGRVAMHGAGDQAGDAEMIPEDLGLSFVRLKSLEQDPRKEGPRGPMSVVSLSESDEGGSEDWEAV